MKIIIISTNEVRIDDRNFGAVADAIANNKSLASDIQRALEIWGNEKDSTISTLEQKISEFQNHIISIETAIKNSQSNSTILSIIKESKKDVIQKEKESLESQILELKAKRALLE